MKVNHIEVEVHAGDSSPDQETGVWVLPEWRDLCEGGRAVMLAIDRRAPVPMKEVLDASAAVADGWLISQSAKAHRFERLELRGDGWRVLIEPRLTPEVLRLLLIRGLLHFMADGASERGDYISITDPHEVLL